VDDAVLETPGEIPLGRDGVEVTGEDDEWDTGTPAAEEKDVAVIVQQRSRHDTPHVVGELGLPAALGRDVHELERPSSESLSVHPGILTRPRHNSPL
jgi:hypothetical protein